MIAILFMKEHSERLPHKNIRDFCGKPLFYWVLSTLSKVSQIEKIVIDTDSTMIKEKVHAYFPDITILDRPKHLLGDQVTANTLIGGMISKIDGNDFLQTHVTNPLLKASTITSAINCYRSFKRKHDSLFSVTIHNSPCYKFDGEPINHDPETIEQSQLIEPIYEDNSNLYIFSRECFNLWGRVGLNPYLFNICKTESIDINTEEDWKMAEAIKLYEENRKRIL